MAREGLPSKRGGHARQRRHPGMRGRRPDRKAARVQGALERAVWRGTLTDEKQVGALDRRMGRGAGARRERAKLLVRIGRQAGKPRAA